MFSSRCTIACACTRFVASSAIKSSRRIRLVWRRRSLAYVPPRNNNKAAPLRDGKIRERARGSSSCSATKLPRANLCMCAKFDSGTFFELLLHTLVVCCIQTEYDVYVITSSRQAAQLFLHYVTSAMSLFDVVCMCVRACELLRASWLARLTEQLLLALANGFGFAWPSDQQR